MYRLRDANGQESGPYSIEQIREGLLLGHLAPETSVCREGDTAWQTLGTLLAPPLPPSPSAARSTPPPLPRRVPTLTQASLPPLPPAAPARPPLSGWAIASIVLAFAGVFILPAIAGFLCGIVALVKVQRSRGALRGRGMALSAIFLSIVSVVVVGILAPMLINNNRRAWRPPPPPAMVNTCWLSLPKLGKAVLHYANDHADLLPQGTNWCDAIRDYVPSLSVFTCPGAPAEATSIFAMNQSLAGKSLDQVAPETVLLFECDPGWNVAGGRESVAKHGISPGVVYVFTVGGQVQMVPLASLGVLRWSP